MGLFNNFLKRPFRIRPSQIPKFLEQLINEKLLIQEAKEQGIDIADEIGESEIESIIETNGQSVFKCIVLVTFAYSYLLPKLYAVLQVCLCQKIKDEILRLQLSISDRTWVFFLVSTSVIHTGKFNMQHPQH